MGALLMGALLLLAACQKDGAATSTTRAPTTRVPTTRAPTASATTAPTSTAPATTAPTPTVTATPTAAIETGTDGDYSAIEVTAKQYKSGAITFTELEKYIRARKLPTHRAGDGHLMIPSPRPPPGIEFNPRIMPKSWEGTWGEVAMMFWLGYIERAEYHRLHAAEHPNCKP